MLGYGVATEHRQETGAADATVPEGSANAYAMQETWVIDHVEGIVSGLDGEQGRLQTCVKQSVRRCWTM